MKETSLLTPDDIIIQERIAERSLYNKVTNSLLQCPECVQICKGLKGLSVHLRQTHGMNYEKIDEHTKILKWLDSK